MLDLFTECSNSNTEMASDHLETRYAQYTDRSTSRQTDVPGRYRPQRRAEAELGREDDGSVELRGRRPWQEESVLHEKLYLSDSDDSSVDENYEVESLAESIPDQLS